MTDSTHLALLPALMNRLSAVAPSIQVEITHISNQTPKMLESGDADLAVGYMPALEAGFYQQKLFDQNFACVVQREHPRVRSRLPGRPSDANDTPSSLQQAPATSWWSGNSSASAFRDGSCCDCRTCSASARSSPTARRTGTCRSGSRAPLALTDSRSLR